MSQAEYVFQDTENQQELDRLRAIEAIFDPATCRCLLSAGIQEGWQCLEVGPGAGSVMAWMAGKVGPSGRVTAVDINTRFINKPFPNVRVIEGDIRTLALEPESFDLIHARYVLIHVPAFQTVLELLRDALKPNGRLVIEEPDFSVSRVLAGEEAEIQAFRKVHRAVIRMYESKEMDPAIGVKLASLLHKLGLKNLLFENEALVSQGGSGIADMMRMSACQLRDKYIATGEVTAEDMENYDTFTQNQDSRAVYYATLRVDGQK